MESLLNTQTNNHIFFNPFMSSLVAFFMLMATPPPAASFCFNTVFEFTNPF